LVKVHKRKSNTKISVETWPVVINNSSNILHEEVLHWKKYNNTDKHWTYKQRVFSAGVFNAAISNNFACHPVTAKWLFYGSTPI
jgi:hypothetical protein